MTNRESTQPTSASVPIAIMWTGMERRNKFVTWIVARATPKARADRLVASGYSFDGPIMQ